MNSIYNSKLFVNSWVNSYSVEVSAFAGIANKVSSISNLVSAAMNTGGSTMVGQNLAAKEYGREGDLVAGANIAGFLKVAEAMKAQGVC